MGREMDIPRMQPDVVVHIDTNDIGRKRDGKVKQEFREVGGS